MNAILPSIAGFIATALLAIGTIPMLEKAISTKNLASYSLGNILISNVGNVIYSIYVFKLPIGPVWFLHGYNMVTTGLMLSWYMHYEILPHHLWSSKWLCKTLIKSPNCCSSSG